MKNFGRKMLSSLIAFSMVSAVLPLGVMAKMSTITATDGHYMKFEETDRSDRFLGFQSSETSNANMSGGKCQVEWNTNSYGGDLQFDVDIPETGTYKIWVHGGTSNSPYCSPSALIVDKTWSSFQYTAGTVLNWEEITGSKTEAGMNLPTAYHMVTADLTAGTHTIDYYHTAKRSSDNTYYAGVFDFMIIMPSDYEWTPGIDTLPTAPAAPTATPEPTATPTPTATPVPAYKSFTEGGYAWLEELDYSNREAGFSQNNSVASMSGGKVRVNWATTYGELDFTVNIPDTGEYTIWVYGGDSSNENVSPSKLVLDNTTDRNWEIIQGGTTESGMSIRTAYHKVTATLTAGIHTFKYILTAHRPADSYYAGAFDFMVIMPSNYSWTPSKTEVPAPSSGYHEDEYIWQEEKEYSNREAGFGQFNSVAGMSGEGQNIRVHWAATYGELDFTVNIAKAGDYKIWVHGGDISNSSVSPAKLVLDGETDLNINNVQSEAQVSGMSFQMAYQSADVTLTAGTHTIKYILTDHRSSDSNYVGALDFIAIVPARAQFTPVSGNVTSTKLDYYMSMLMLDYDLSNVTEDITLLDALVDDTQVTWSSGNTSVIANDGTVTRPIGSDAVVTLTATAGGYSKEFAVTVKGIEEYDISSFAIGGSTSAGGTTTATATVARNAGSSGTLYLILAVYTDGDEEMIDCDIAEAVISSTPVTLDCSVEIDSTQSGALHARAYLWEDLSNLKSITDAIKTN